MPVKILVGSNNALLRDQASAWTENPRLLSELEAWGKAREGEWGECFLFLEVLFPPCHPTSKNRQFDLIVAFDEKVAICEIKRGYRANLNAQEIVEQFHGQQRTFGALLRQGGIRRPDGQGGDGASLPGEFGMVVFCPRLRAYELRSMRESFVPHAAFFQIAGCREDLREPAVDGLVYHLRSVIESALVERTAGRQANGGGVQRFLRGVLSQGEYQVLEYESSSDALQALRSFARAPHLTFPRGHVEGARETEFAAAIAKLRDNRIVELCGAPESGKTILAKELIRQLEYPFLEFKLGPDIPIAVGREHITLEDVVSALEEDIEGVVGPPAKDVNAVARLAHETVLFWIKRYSDDYRTGLSDLIEHVRSVRSPVNAYWILESLRPLQGCADLRVDLRPMDRAVLARLLAARSPGGLHTIEQAIDTSNGNPGAAIRAWTASEPPEPEQTQFGWFESHLNPIEKQVLSCLCFVIARSPFGVSREMLDGFLQAVHTDLPTRSRKESIESLLESLQNEQLASVASLSCRRFGGLLDQIIPSDADFVFVNAVNPQLVRSVTTRLSPQRACKLVDIFERVWVAAASTGNLAESTYEISVTKNLESLLRSTFSYTSAAPLLRWIESAGWEPPDQRQAYLLRALRILPVVRRREPPFDLDCELGPPHPEDPVQRFAWDLIAARSGRVGDLGERSQPARWRAGMDQTNDPDVRAALCLSRARALRAAHREQDAWDLLEEALEQWPPNTSAHSVLCLELGDLMNRKEGRSLLREADDPEQNRIATYSRSLVQAGLRSENIQLICAGLFYYARAEEFNTGRTAFRKVLGYLSALDWIEHVPGAWANWKMRVLLTRGSIHRHYLRESSLTWDDYAMHLKLAWADYTRAFNLACKRPQVMHIMNSLSYSSGLCRGAFRYGADPEARRQLPGFIETVLARCEFVRANVVCGGDKEIEVWHNVERAEAIHLFVVNVAAMSSHTATATPHKLADRWTRFVDLMIEARSRRDHKALKDGLKDLSRGLRFAEQLSLPCHLRLYRTIDGHMQRLLDGTKLRSPNEGHAALWREVTELASRYRRESQADSR